jgi:serine/threonine protein kinase
MADRMGQQLGNYRLIRQLGKGGVAVVYLGEHVHLKTKAAIKVLRSEDLIDLDDAFYVTKDKEGDTKVHPSVHLTSFICTIRLQLAQRYFSRFILLKKSHDIINGLSNLFAGRGIRCLQAIKKLAEDS